ncbi:hypothetical protein SAMN06265173_101198 [Thalassovita litoralis]|uniref:Uncharacterized protein n=1 Tax=Thalassovita litoralis TaxID=1010611 RepID=A0A521AJA2_9RHOB|nr:hypothetical protein SAMN06265173_101198 [Thalassovita litoralis]
MVPFDGTFSSFHTSIYTQNSCNFVTLLLFAASY